MLKAISLGPLGAQLKTMYIASFHFPITGTFRARKKLFRLPKFRRSTADSETRQCQNHRHTCNFKSQVYDSAFDDKVEVDAESNASSPPSLDTTSRCTRPGPSMRSGTWKTPRYLRGIFQLYMCSIPCKLGRVCVFLHEYLINSRDRVCVFLLTPVPYP